MFECFDSVMFGCTLVGCYGRMDGIICLIGAIVRCGGHIWLLVI